MIEITLNYIFIIFLFLILFILASIEYKFNKILKKNILLIIVIIFSLFAGFRVIGTDINSYKLIFENQTIILLNFEFIKQMLTFQIEPAFILLISYLKYFHFPFKVFLFISALIPMLLIYRVVVKTQKRYLILSFLLFLMLNAISGPLDVIRQFFAASIYLSALYSLSIKKEFKFWLKATLAIFFHYSSVVIFIIRPFLTLKWDIKKYLFCFLVFSILGNVFEKYIIQYSSSMNVTSTDRFLFKFQSYIDSNLATNDTLSTVLLYGMTYIPVILNILLVIIALKNRSEFYDNLFLKVVLNSQIIGTLLLSFFISIGAVIMGNRIETFLGIGSSFILTKIIINLKGKNRLMYVYLIMYLLIYILFQFLYLVKLRTNVL